MVEGLEKDGIISKGWTLIEVKINRDMPVFFINSRLLETRV